MYTLYHYFTSFLKSPGSRLKTSLDFGHVQLTIQGVRPQDSGIYTCKATNKLGEAVSTTSIKVDGKRRQRVLNQRAYKTALFSRAFFLD